MEELHGNCVWSRLCVKYIYSYIFDYIYLPWQANMATKQIDREIMKTDMSDMSSCQMKSEFHSCKQGLISTSLCVWLFQAAILLSTLWLIQSNVASIYWLVVSNMFFHHIGNVIIPTDELIFFRGVGQPPTRNWYSQLETSVASGIFQARPKGLFPESGWSGVQLWLHATPEGRGLESFHSKLPG